MTFPDPGRAGVAAVRIRQGDGSPELSAPAPAAGRLSHTVFTGDEGWFTYEQWAREPEPDGSEFHLYRSARRPDAPPAGCVVLVSVAFDSPDEARLKAWVDTIFEALADSRPHPGGISAHFHLSADGTRVANYAEWVSEAAHLDALGETGFVGSSPKFQVAQAFPGLVGSTVRRYRPIGRLDVADRTGTD
ncbi:antibiotic biosynthesis monooxygenase [Amycolatopsis sp. NPDC001319]|uniref:antibiotic biosynthesis monooxygenase n=1 Tax=unclassified Amycolatopsis TaxID=2618356 RepID=UPI0036BCD13F